MGTLTRTLTGVNSSGGQYWAGGDTIKMYNSPYDSGAISGATLSSASITVKNFKSFGSCKVEFYIGSTRVGKTTNSITANANVHDFYSALTDLDSAILTATGNLSIKLVDAGGSGNRIYAYPPSEHNGTQIEVIAVATYSACTPPSSVTLNNTAGNVNVVEGTSMTLRWSGASGGGSINPIVGYQVYRGNDPYGDPTTSTSMGVECPPAGSSYSYSVVTLGQRESSGRSTARSVYAYTHPSAPTTVSISASVADAGTNVRLSWSGSSGGTGNPVQKYQVYRSETASGSYAAYGSQISSMYMDVPTNSIMGSSYYYKVAAIGAYSSSPLSTATAGVTTKVYSQVTAPTSVTVSPNVASANNQATLSWNNGTGGTNTTITSYGVYRSSDPLSGYTLLQTVTGNSVIVTAPPTEGATYYYKVMSISSKSGFDSELSNAYGSLAVPIKPDAPVFSGLEGCSYNARPRVLVTVPAEKVTGVKQTVSAPGWTASRTAVSGLTKVVLRKDTAYSHGQTASVTFTNADNYGAETSVSEDIVYTDPYWTDDPVEAGTTAIKAAHIIELRVAVNNLRAWYGMPEHTWEEEIIAGVTSSVNWASHAQEIKDQIEAIQKHINDWDITNAALDVSLPTISTFYAPKADVINKLRQAITLL